MSCQSIKNVYLNTALSPSSSSVSGNAWSQIHKWIVKITCIDKVCPVIAEEIGEVEEGGLKKLYKHLFKSRQHQYVWKSGISSGDQSLIIRYNSTHIYQILNWIKISRRAVIRRPKKVWTLPHQNKQQKDSKIAMPHTWVKTMAATIMASLAGPDSIAISSTVRINCIAKWNQKLRRWVALCVLCPMSLNHLQDWWTVNAITFSTVRCSSTISLISS